MAKNIPNPTQHPRPKPPIGPDRPCFLRQVASPAPGGRSDQGDLNIRIDRNGVWHYQGSPINRKEMVCLFASVLERDTAGVFWLVTPTEMGRVVVDDAPFLAVELYVAGAGSGQAISFRTNVDEIITADSDHPITVLTDPGTGEPSPYVTVRPGIEARLSRAVFYELAALAVEGSGAGRPTLGVWSMGTFFPLDSLDVDR
ncbi:MAG: DUF1285 domain-containing protein [Rhodospirillales bacterium]|nr:MAG: DUF1285 domain-containing protein [Rhodospirillales bacterium]